MSWTQTILGFFDNGPWELLAIPGALFLALAFHAAIFWGIERFTRATPARWDALIPRHLKSPSRLFLAAFSLQIVRPIVSLPASWQGALEQILNIVLTVCIAWLLICATYLLREALVLNLDVTASDNLRSRKILTQVRALQNVLIAVISLASIAMVLMTFQGVRQIGVSILASAGIAGIVLGVAAQKTLGSLIAGIQIALTQPIRIDDVVIVEGEWGRIEEITLTYVVIHIWDERQLVVPIAHFIEKPFQNWTRSSSQIMGSVLLYCDPATPVDRIRVEAERLTRASPLWDKRVFSVQVTDCRSDVIEIRVLTSAADSSASWDLRCLLRESLLDYLRRELPEGLPRHRIRLDPDEHDLHKNG